jgi:hypothetical protein
MDNLDIFIKNNILSYLKYSEKYSYLTTSKSELLIEKSSSFNKILLHFLKNRVRENTSSLLSAKARLENIESIIYRLRSFSLIDVDNDL